MKRRSFLSRLSQSVAGVVLASSIEVFGLVETLKAPKALLQQISEDWGLCKFYRTGWVEYGKGNLSGPGCDSSNKFIIWNNLHRKESQFRLDQSILNSMKEVDSAIDSKLEALYARNHQKPS